MNYGNYKGNLPFQISVYSGIDPLLEYLENSDVGILLLGEEYIESLSILETVISNIFILWEGQSPKETYHVSCIYKYQSAGDIIGQLYELYIEQDSHGGEYMRIAPTHNNYIVGVFSPKNTNKRNLFALILSEYYGIKESTLYVNLDLFNQFTWLKEESGGLSEILYYVKQRKPNLALKIESIVSKYGHFNVISPAIHYQDLYEITEDDVDFLLECLREYCEYKVIVIDIGAFGKGIKRVLEGCDKVYLPIEHNQIDGDKLSAFKRQMKESSTERFMERFQEVELPCKFSFVDENQEVDFINNESLYDYVAAVVESGETVEWRNPQI